MSVPGKLRFKGTSAYCLIQPLCSDQAAQDTVKLFSEQLSSHPVPASSHPQSKISFSCLSETSSISIFTKKSLSLPSVHPSIKYLSLLIRFHKHYYLQVVCLLCLEVCCWRLVNFSISVCVLVFFRSLCQTAFQSISLQHTLQHGVAPGRSRILHFLILNFLRCPTTHFSSLLSEVFLNDSTNIRSSILYSCVLSVHLLRMCPVPSFRSLMKVLKQQ